MGLAWQQWYKKIWDTKLIEYFWQYFDNHRIIDVIWQSIKWHVRAVWRSKLLLQCWSFSTTAPTTRIASKPWKPRQTMDQTSATSVEVPKRLSNFSPQTFFKSIQWGLQKFHKWCTHWKVEQSVFNMLLTCIFITPFLISWVFSSGGNWWSPQAGPGYQWRRAQKQWFLWRLASLKWQVAIPVSCHEAPLLATMWKNWTQQILDNLPWMTKRERRLTFCNQLTSTYTSRIQKLSHIEKKQCVWQNI